MPSKKKKKKKGGGLKYFGDFEELDVYDEEFISSGQKRK